MARFSSVAPSAARPAGRVGARRRSVSVVLLATVVALVLGAFVPDATAAKRRRVRKVGPDFNIVVSPDAQRVGGGQRASFPVFIQAIRGFKSIPSFDIDGVPAYIDSEIARLGTNRYQLDLIVPPNAPSSNGVYRLYAKAGSRERVALFRLEVVGPSVPPPPPPTQPPVTQPPVTQPPVTQPPVTQPPTIPPSFIIRADTIERGVTTGETTSFGITVERQNGWQGAVSFALTGAPNGLAANFSPNPTTASTNLYVTAGPNVASGRYVMSVVATAGTVQRVAAIALTVTTTADFALLATPTTNTLRAAGNVTYRIDIASPSSVRPTVTFEVSGVPTGASARFSANPATTASNLVVTTTANTPAGTYPITVTGRSGIYSRQVVVQLVVESNAPGFGLQATPASFNLTRPGRNQIQVNIRPFGNFRGNVTLTTSQLPTGVKLLGVTGSGTSAILTFEADTTAQAGTSKFLVTGTSGNLVATVEVTLTVQ